MVSYFVIGRALDTFTKCGILQNAAHLLGYRLIGDSKAEASRRRDTIRIGAGSLGFCSENRSHRRGVQGKSRSRNREQTMSLEQ